MLQYYLHGVDIPLQTYVLFSLGQQPVVELVNHMVFLIFNMLRKLRILPQWLHPFTFPPTMHEGSFSSTSPLILVISYLCDSGLSDSCEVLSHCGFGLRFFNDSDVEHLFILFQLLCMSFWGKLVFRCATHLLIWWFVISMVTCRSTLYIWEMNTLLEISLVNIISHSVVCLFIVLMVCFLCCAKASYFVLFPVLSVAFV